MISRENSRKQQRGVPNADTRSITSEPKLPEIKTHRSPVDFALSKPISKNT